MRFELGRLVATPGALEALQASGQTPDFFVAKHASGDWGDVCPDDAALNDAAVKDGSRILSAYRTLRGAKVWVITEAEGDGGKRASTCILLPEEY